MLNKAFWLYMFVMSLWLLWGAWMLLLPKFITKRRVKRLRIGSIYVRRGKNPFDADQMVIVDIKAGHVQWRYVRADGGLSDAQSERADWFADSKELVANP